MKVILLILFAWMASATVKLGASTEYYNVKSYCLNNRCPATYSESRTIMGCPKEGNNTATLTWDLYG